MALLEDLRPGAHVKGLLPGKLVTLIEVKRYGASVAEVTYRNVGGDTGSMLLYQDDAARLEIASEDLPWSFDADGVLFRLVSEAYRISLAYLFDPLNFQPVARATGTSLAERAATTYEFLPQQGGMCRWTAHGQRLFSRALSPRLCVSFLSVVNDMSDPGS